MCMAIQCLVRASAAIAMIENGSQIPLHCNALRVGTTTLMAAAAIIAGGHVSDEAAAAAASDLLLLAASIRFLEFSAPAAGTNGSRTTEAHPALHIMQQAYPVIAALLEAPAWRLRAEVVDAACEAYRRTLLSVKARSSPPSPRLGQELCMRELTCRVLEIESPERI